METQRTHLWLPLLLAGLLLACATLQTAVAEPSGQTASILRTAASLDYEKQRYLVYLYTRIGRTDLATALGEMILTKTPSDRDTLIELASVYSIEKKISKLARIVGLLEKYYAGEVPTRYYRANLNSLGGDVASAREILVGIGAKDNTAEGVGMLVETASIHARNQDWPRAVHVYKDLLESGALNPELRGAVRRSLDAIALEHTPFVEPALEYSELESGSTLLATVDAEVPLSARWTLGARLRKEEIDIDTALGLRGDRYQREQALADFGYLAAPGLTLTATLGGNNSGPALGWEIEKKWKYHSLAFLGEWKQHSQEGLLFEALDGRQNRLALRWNGSLFTHYQCTLEPSVRQLVVDGSDLGLSTGLSGGIERVLWRHWITVTASYRGSYYHFDPAEPSPSAADNIYLPPPPVPEPEPVEEEPVVADAAAVVETPVVEEEPAAEEELPVVTVNDEKRLQLLGLITEETQRHGFYLSFQSDLTTLLRWRLSAGSDYILELDSFGHTGTAGISFTPCKTLEFNLDSAYSTSGGGSNTGSTLKQLSLAMKWLF